jgi:endonuclease/exonuclease/phosphatase family metal-dependent hydrolase
MSSLRIATWNIRKSVGLDRRRDPRRILEGIAAFAADIVVLQEADRRLPPRPSSLPIEIIAETTGLRPVAVPGEVSLGHHGNAILLAPSLAVVDAVPLDLPGLEPRGALIVRVTRAQMDLDLAAVHLGLTRRFRVRQLEAIAGAMADLGSRNAVIAGDFNEWLAGRPFPPLEAGFKVHSPGPTFHTARPVAPLDRIATSPGLRVTKITRVQTPLTRVASDHLPVVADIEVVA